MTNTSKLTDIELGWLAGIIDGEGCFNCRLNRKNTILIRFTLHSCSVKMQSQVSSLLKKTGIKFSESIRTHKQKPYQRDSYILDVNNKSALLKLLRLITDYLVVKKPEAKLILSYLEKACLVKCYSPTQKDLLIVEEVKYLKRVS